jgi:CheY-like chemotaxis protein
MNNKIDFILFIDDDEAVRFLHKIMAEEADVSNKIIEAKGGDEGIDLLLDIYNSNRTSRGVVFMDINMPVTNGWMVLDELKNQCPDLIQHVDIYMVTSSEYPKDLKRIRLEPMVKGHIPKPLSAENIMEAAQKLTAK